MWTLLPLFFFLLSGCSFSPGNLQSRRSIDLESRRIRRIAVLPPVESPAPRLPALSSAPVEAKNPERDAPEILARIVHSAMSAMPNWQIVSDSEVREVSQPLAGMSEAERMRQLGAMVYADAVLVPRVRRYRERVGDEWGAKSPASVSFVLDLVDVRRGDVIWSATFDETQKSLTENIFALGDIGTRGVRWLSAEQLAQEGVKKAVGQLHQMIAHPPG